MPAFYRDDVGNFLAQSPELVSGKLSEALVKDFSGYHSNQLATWKKQIELLHSVLSKLVLNLPQIRQSTVIFEYSMIRLQKRLDVVLLLGQLASEDFSHAAFLSGNTPLVTVLREALAQDKSRRTGIALNITRREVRTKVRGLMNFLEHYLKAHPSDPPDEHVVVFDEAQRAWDAKYGFEKFERPSSEPALFLEIMERHDDWAVIVGLVGGGQEINKGERGLREWGDALLARRKLSQAKPWRVVAAPDALSGGDATAWQSLFPDDVPPVWACADTDLHLGVSVRSYRCLAVTRWVNALLEGRIEDAKAIASDAQEFPIYLTRSLATAREWLRKNTRGSRRCGLTASSGARRLRAEGLGVSLSATELGDVANWYLCGRVDIRSSYALEVTANEYTCRG
jgi:hypothetical protein